jgi:hypothetical protein
MGLKSGRTSFIAMSQDEMTKVIPEEDLSFTGEDRPLQNGSFLVFYGSQAI